MTCRRVWLSSLTMLLLLPLLLQLLSPYRTMVAAMPWSYRPCKVNESLRAEIAAYRPVVDRVLQYVRDKQGYRGRTWTELAEFVDTFGSRLAGSANLEAAIDYMKIKLGAEGLENVRTEEVLFGGWNRNYEVAWLLKPRPKNLQILGLGGSVGTHPRGIRAEVMVVSSFEDLKHNAVQAFNKIVVFNQPFVSYGETVKYRSSAASVASKYGALAVLVRSVTPFSLYTPHAGQMTYTRWERKIPAASITVEDAELLQRMYNRGTKMKIWLRMDPKKFSARSRNTIAELEGSTYINKTVLVSGHLDSWDVGQGAMDDGGGAFISWNSLVVLKNLGLRPKRTIRCVLWTAEEQGYLGAKAYLKAHRSELDNFSLVIESDDGTFQPYGIAFHGSEMAGCIMTEVAKLFDSINATTMVSQKENVGSDIEVFEKLNVPGASLLNRNEKYFWYHHTEADTMDVLDPDSLDLNTAMFAAMSYIIADLSTELPRS